MEVAPSDLSDDDAGPTPSEVDVSSSSSSEDSDDCEVDDDWAPILYLHKLGKLHKGKPDDQMLTLCMKVLSVNYTRVELSEVETDAQHCINCFGAERVEAIALHDSDFELDD